MNDRNELVDCLKGYACLLVVFGHVIMGLRQAGGDIPGFEYPTELFIWTYHVSLFFFLSGYVYKITKKWEPKGSRLKFISYKFINLAVPYFSISTLYILANSLTSGTNTNFSVSDIFLLWKTPVAQYWYIYALFILLFLYAVLSKVGSDIAITAFLVLLVYIRAFVYNFNLPILGIALGHAFCFGLGVCLPDIQYFNRKNMLPLLIAAHVASVALIFSLQLNDIVPFKDYMKLIGIATSVSLIGFLSENKTIRKALLFINKWCFQIYLLHTFFTSAIRILMIKLSIQNFYLQTILGMVIGLAFPILIGWCCSKTVVFNIIFFPTRTVKQLKKEYITK